MPSYHEGMSNVILEASASGRPVLASVTDSRLRGEGFEDGVTGFGFAPRDREALLQARCGGLWRCLMRGARTDGKECAQ